MSRPPVNPNDPRRRYGHQAFDVTTFGKSIESGPSGYNKRLSGTYQASILMNADAGVGTDQLLGDLTQGGWVMGMINHVPLTSGTMKLTLPAFNGLPAQDVTTMDIDLTIGSVIFNNVDAAMYIPLAQDRPLVATVTGGTAGETAVVSLLVTPAENGWF